jgi:hypothetical protein
MEQQYVQMTLNDWLALKGKLEAELRGAAAGFVRIGYLLRKIDETEGYKNDGSKSLAEWAKDNYGLSATAVSRFMAINKKYSIDGYSDQLRLEYSQYGSAKLSEMLALPDSDLEMVSPQMKREDIREIKKFNREMEEVARNPKLEEEQKPDETIVVEEAPAVGFAEPVPPDNYKWVLEFFRENGEILNELFSSAAYENSNYDAMKEIVNPSGARTFRHKLTMVSMLEGKIVIKTFGKPQELMSWERFIIVTEAVIGHDRIDGSATYRKTFGQDPVEKSPEAPKAEPEKPITEQKVLKSEPKMPKPAPKVLKPEPKAPEPEKEVPEEPRQQAEEPVAPAQKEPPTIDNSNVKTDSAIAENSPSETAEEPEQVEIDEILPPPVEPDPIRDLKDRFAAELNSLRIMMDCNNFSGMAQIIGRLKELCGKMAVLTEIQN